MQVSSQHIICMIFYVGIFQVGIYSSSCVSVFINLLQNVVVGTTDMVWECSESLCYKVDTVQLHQVKNEVYAKL